MDIIDITIRNAIADPFGMSGSRLNLRGKLVDLGIDSTEKVFPLAARRLIQAGFCQALEISPFEIEPDKTVLDLISHIKGHLRPKV